MKLTGLVSPGIWDLLERLRPHLDVTIELFDTALAPLLPREERDAARALRAVAELGADGDPTSPRGILVGALRTGTHHLFVSDGLHVGVFPLRLERTVVGLLATAVVETHATRETGETIDRHLERVGWSLRATLEAEIAVGGRLTEEQRLTRWLNTILSFLEHLHTCRTHDDLFESVVQAAAIWGDYDARIYERGLEGTYVLRTVLPSLAEPAPRQFGTALLESHPGVARISSMAELEALGWHPLRGELLLLSVPALPGEASRWVLTIGGEVDARFERVFAVVTRTLGTCASALEGVQARRLSGRLVEKLADAATRFPVQAASLLGELTSAVGASHARILLQEADGAPPRVIASVGATLVTDAGNAWPDHKERLSSDRLAFPLQVGLAWPAILELGTLANRVFTSADATLAREASSVVEVWLTGALKGLTDEARGAVPGLLYHGFEARIQEEIERARRFNLETGLLIVDTAESSRDRHALSLTPLIEAVRSQLRGSDLVGRLQDGRLAALLVHTDAKGIAAVASRVRDRLATVPGEGPGAVLGRATYPAAGESADALVASARRDLDRQAVQSTL